MGNERGFCPVVTPNTDENNCVFSLYNIILERSIQATHTSSSTKLPYAYKFSQHL